MEALAEQKIFCFEKMVLRLGIIIAAMTIFSQQNMSLNAYGNTDFLKGYISVEDNNLFLMQNKWIEEINKKYGNGNIKVIDNGVIYVRMNKVINSRNIKINVAEINRSINPKIEIIPQMASDDLHSKSKLSNIAKHAQTLVAINGTYFKQDTGTPLGALVINNEIITGPIYERVGMGITEKGFVTSRISFEGKIKHNKQEIKIDNINQPRMLYSQVLIYTNKWGVKSPEMKSHCRQIAVKGNKIIAISDYPLIIPEGGVVISAQKEKFSEFKLGDRINISYNLNPEWKDAKHIISGGPYLLKENKVYIDCSAEKLNGITGRNPRTAIGYTEDNTMIMVTVDGRKEGSSGVTLNELAQIMKSLGCVEAINLDGGSSTVMYVNGNILNGTNVQGVRVSNALSVVINE